MILIQRHKAHHSRLWVYILGAIIILSAASIVVLGGMILTIILFPIILLLILGAGIIRKVIKQTHQHKKSMIIIEQ